MAPSKKQTAAKRGSQTPGARQRPAKRAKTKATAARRGNEEDDRSDPASVDGVADRGNDASGDIDTVDESIGSDASADEWSDRTTRLTSTRAVSIALDLRACMTRIESLVPKYVDIVRAESDVKALKRERDRLRVLVFEMADDLDVTLRRIRNLEAQLGAQDASSLLILTPSTSPA